MRVDPPTSIVLQGKHCLIASSGFGVYSSDDNGNHFQLIGSSGSRCSSVALIQDPNHGWYHYAASAAFAERTHPWNRVGVKKCCRVLNAAGIPTIPLSNFCTVSTSSSYFSQLDCFQLKFQLS